MPDYYGLLDAASERLLLAIGRYRSLRFIWAHPAKPQTGARTSSGPLRLELVTHCWNYSHLLAYQLGSIIDNPPRSIELTFTVFYSREDIATRDLLDRTRLLKLENVRWNFIELPPQRLKRRAIGRNLSALQTKSDWIWFTDCDVLFGAGCLDALGPLLNGSDQSLLYPAREWRCDPLPEDDPRLLLEPGEALPRLADAQFEFKPYRLSRATGPMQIVRGDLARTIGYCRDLSWYQKPMRHWAKATEDRVFRWLCGTDGAPVDIDPVLRIQHIAKGRYLKRGDARGWILLLRRWLQARHMTQLARRQADDSLR